MENQKHRGICLNVFERMFANRFYTVFILFWNSFYTVFILFLNSFCIFVSAFSVKRLLNVCFGPNQDVLKNPVLDLTKTSLNAYFGTNQGVFKTSSGQCWTSGLDVFKTSVCYMGIRDLCKILLHIIIFVILYLFSIIWSILKTI